MIGFSALASGSNGNCYFFQDKDDAVLIDAGISAREIVQRMNNLSLSIAKIRGIFVTHEHIDHIKGVEVLSKKFNIPVYITKKTLTHSSLNIPEELIKIVRVESTLSIGNIELSCFSKQHDAIDPCSYAITAHGRKVSVMTDLGTACNNVVHHLSSSDAVFLESNYDEEMLLNGRYPVYLKKRISSDLGHLSNYQAALLVLQHATSRLKYLFLSHFSANNNKPELALDLFSSLLKERRDLAINLLATSRDKETPLITL